MLHKCGKQYNFKQRLPFGTICEIKCQNGFVNSINNSSDPIITECTDGWSNFLNCTQNGNITNKNGSELNENQRKIGNFTTNSTKKTFFNSDTVKENLFNKTNSFLMIALIFAQKLIQIIIFIQSKVVSYQRKWNLQQNKTRNYVL